MQLPLRHLAAPLACFGVLQYPPCDWQGVDAEAAVSQFAFLQFAILLPSAMVVLDGNSFRSVGIFWLFAAWRMLCWLQDWQRVAQDHKPWPKGHLG